MDAKVQQSFRPSKKKSRSPFSQKAFLRAVQIMESLRVQLKDTRKTKMQVGTHSTSTNLFYHHKFSASDYRKLCVYYRQLKNLLCQWYYFALRKESNDTVLHNLAFFDKFWLMAGSEAENIGLLTRIQHSGFVDDTFTSISDLKKASESLRNRFQDHVTILKGFSNAINIIDNGCLLVQHHLVLSLSSVSRLYHQKLFTMTSFCINANFYKLYHMDPNNISMDLISVLLWTCESYSKFFESNNEFECDTNRGLRNFSIRTNPAPFFGMISGLANFQAKLASEKLMQCLLSALYADRCKLNEVDSLELLSFQPCSVRRGPDGASTSDYYSVSTNETETFGPCPIPLSAIREQLSEACASVLSRNQSLILKIICSVKNIACGYVPGNNMLVLDESKFNVDASNAWKHRLPGSDVPTVRLEKIYWSVFWDKVTNCMSGMLMETPEHHFSDHHCPGSILVLSDSYSSVVAVILRSLVEFADISSDFHNAFKRIHFTLLTFLSHVLWDRNMCVALKATTRHHCEAVPLAYGKIGNRVASSFSIAFRSASVVFLEDCISRREISLAAQSTNRMICCLDAFHSWAIVRGKAYLSAWDIPTCLLVAYSDVLNDQDLSSFSQYWQVKLHEKSLFICDKFTSTWTQFIATFRQVKELPEEVTYYFQEKVRIWIMKDLFRERNPLLSKIAVIGCQKTSDPGICKVIDEVLNPVYSSAKFVPEDRLVHFLEAFVNSAVQAYLDLCRRRSQSYMKPYRVHVPENDLRDLMFWIEQLEIPDAAKEALETVPSVVKLTYLSSAKRYSSTFSFLRSRRRVRPI